MMLFLVLLKINAFMGTNTTTIDYRQDYYRGLAKVYFNRILATIIKFGDLKKEKGLILDWGCGLGYLKRKLKDNNIVGYDIIPELSDIQDYHNLKPAQIVLNNVLEHLYPQEVRKILTEFQQMNPRVVLLVCLPTENWVSKIMMRLANCKNAHADHVSGYKEINKIIEEKYSLAKRCYIFFRMTQVTKYISPKS